MNEYAPGIPDKQTKSSIPNESNSEWTLNIQHHDADKAGPHKDLRLSPPGSSTAYSWAVPHWPAIGGKSLAIRQPDHTKAYMGFSGEIEDGYGKGKVRSEFYDTVDVLDAKDDKITFVMHEGKSSSRYALIQTGGDNWILYNYTPSVSKGIYKHVPKAKDSYKFININKVEIDHPDEEVFGLKLDGAHNLIVLRKDKRPDVFSYRRRKNTGEFIDHTFKLNFKQRAPESVDNTILRGEVFVPGGSSVDTAARLNSNVKKSRGLQREKPLEVRMFDIVRFKGEDVSTKPYREKLKMLKQIQTELPELKLPPLAETRADKEILVNQMKRKQHPLSAEGLIIYKMNDSVPHKAKIREDYDFKITGTFEATSGSKYEGNGIGGFTGIVQNPEGVPNVELRVGSGLTDKIRKKAYKNPEKYIGRWAKIASQYIHDSGLHMQPVFLEFRIDT